MCLVQNKLLDTVPTQRAERNPAVGLDCQRKANSRQIAGLLDLNPDSSRQLWTDRNA